MRPKQLKRYSRHLLLDEVGQEGQQKLLNAKVLLVGVGGLGCPVALYLTAAGVGQIGLVDFDVVDEGNLQRQVLFTAEDVGKSKAEVAAVRLGLQNSDVKFTVFNERLSSENAARIFEGFDYVVDGTDNFATRYLVNDACVLFDKLNIHGSVHRFEGQVTIYGHRDGPCYRCLFPEPPEAGMIPNCAEAGVLGILPGQIGLVQATETIKLILNKGTSLVRRLLLFDAMDMRWQEMRINRDFECAVCGSQPSVNELIDYSVFCGEKVAVVEDTTKEIVEECKPPIQAGPATRPVRIIHKMIKEEPEAFLLLDVREQWEYDMVHVKGAVHIPLEWLGKCINAVEAYKDKTIVVYCHQGIRSLQAMQMLKLHGFDHLINMAGGIDAWAKQIDTSMETY